MVIIERFIKGAVAANCMGVELKVTAEDVRRFYSGSGWAEFRAKVQSRGDETTLDPNVLVNPISSVVSAFKSWFGCYLKEALGGDFGAYEGAVSRYAETYRILIDVAGRSEQGEKLESRLEELSNAHYSQLSAIAALFGRVENLPQPESFDKEFEELFFRPAGRSREHAKQYITTCWDLMKKDLRIFVAIVNRFYNPQTTSEVIAQITEGGNLNEDYQEQLYAGALHN